MATSSRQGDEISQLLEADHIEKMSFELNGVVVAEAQMGPAVADDPLTGIALRKVKSGDKITVSWIDTQGEAGSAETIVS